MVQAQVETADRLTLHPMLEEAFAVLDRAGVGWALVGPPSDLVGWADDIDLLIAPGQRERAQDALRALGFVQVTGWSGAPDLNLLGYHSPTERWIRFRLATELSFGLYRAFDTGAATGCLIRARRSGSVTFLSPDDAFWILLLRCLLDRGGIDAGARSALRDLAPYAQPDGPLGRVVTAISPPSWSAGRMIACVRRDSWTSLEHLGPVLGRSWRRMHTLRTLWRALKCRGVHTVTAALGVARRRGLQVALLGPDGAGKSTLAAGIRERFPFPVQSVYMGLADAHLPRFAQVSVPGLGHVYLFPITWARWLRAQYHAARGRLVIFDRYVYDALLPARRPRQESRLKPIFRWLLSRSCPTPDLVFVLDVSSEVMYQRKGEFDPALLEAHRQHYLGLQGRIPRLHVIDAARARGAVQNEVLERIWHQYIRRWTT